MSTQLIEGNCLEIMKGMEKGSISLVFGSPPYNKQRSYGISFDKEGQDWVSWMVEIFEESLRICNGLVAFVVGHGTNEIPFKWDCTPALLCADLHRKGINLRDPKWYHRNGIPGSGGNDDLRRDIEWIICATNGGKLPWSDNKACGHKPKYKPGGVTTHRKKDGTRVNKHIATQTSGSKNGDIKTKKVVRTVTDIVNPGNVIHCSVGGGKMGSKLAESNEAPFHIDLARFFIKTFCPPNGTVLDPFVGSGTTLAAAIETGRNAIGIDIRKSQIELSKRRLEEAEMNKGFGLIK